VWSPWIRVNITKLSDGTSSSVNRSSAKRRAMNDGNDAAPVTTAGRLVETQSRAISRAPSSRAIPSAPWRITMSWFQANAGRASGASTFIHARVVWTRHS
jgi:hypothetical protein